MSEETENESALTSYETEQLRELIQVFRTGGDGKWRDPQNPFAFPKMEVAVNGNNTSTASGPGMTLRDYFAGQALVGLLSDCVKAKIDPDDATAIAAYGYADAMLKEREKKA